jgi:putative heme-binding domain-containing protein
MLYELLPKASPATRHDIVTLLSSGKTLLGFLQRMDRGEVPKSMIGPEQRWGLQRNKSPEIKELADRLFGSISSDRAAVIEKYGEVAKLKGDSQKGHQVFQTICITCHKIRGEGVEIGPDITDVRIKPVEALLTDILDPNRICEPRFMAYQVDTKDGRVVAGIVAAETSDSVTLKLAGGVTEAVPRSNIKVMKCLDQSLMPVGLEATINPQQMADLIAFLRGE